MINMLNAQIWKGQKYAIADWEFWQRGGITEKQTNGNARNKKTQR